jgi:hypothetical protein
MSVQEKREHIISKLNTVNEKGLDVILEALNMLNNEDPLNEDMIKHAMDIIKERSNLLRKLAQ